ncbi:RDD family protein [Bacillus luteolus]|uniref:RDD family protein n=1 Tax=Litchfieldia luteola TaxID=682179 RepID=A0ABR9QIF7_9BACI|nr:RDD family protein [Cytobacillus luteolus]MBE4908278.1 RDD family protein [Cytobacillus luteolus]MBP1943064.1 putative RDD family membrane protein YckC [Cytobacillus luteolus]
MDHTIVQSNEDQIEEVSKQHNSNPLHANSAVPYAGFWMRFWAYLVDLIVIGSINRIIIYPVLRYFEFPLSDSNMFAISSVATAITFYLYFVLMTKFLSQTLGKMIFGLKVIELHGENIKWSTVFFREFIGKFISKFLFIGYILVAFLPKKQGLHDIFADTTVIHEK